MERKVAEFYHNMVKMTYFLRFPQTIYGVLAITDTNTNTKYKYPYNKLTRKAVDLGRDWWIGGEPT